MGSKALQFSQVLRWLRLQNCLEGLRKCRYLSNSGLLLFQVHTLTAVIWLALCILSLGSDLTYHVSVKFDQGSIAWYLRAHHGLRRLPGKAVFWLPELADWEHFPSFNRGDLLTLLETCSGKVSRLSLTGWLLHDAIFVDYKVRLDESLLIVQTVFHEMMGDTWREHFSTQKVGSDHCCNRLLCWGPGVLHNFDTFSPALLCLFVLSLINLNL